MHTHAITVFIRQDGTAVQTAGFDTPVEVQVEALAEAGRLNRSPVEGAVRGEVWTRGQVKAATYFEPAAAAPAASPSSPVEEASEPSSVPSDLSVPSADAAPPPAAPLSGKRKTS